MCSHAAVMNFELKLSNCSRLHFPSSTTMEISIDYCRAPQLLAVLFERRNCFKYICHSVKHVDLWSICFVSAYLIEAELKSAT